MTAARAATLTLTAAERRSLTLALNLAIECQGTYIAAIDTESPDSAQTLRACERNRRQFELLLARVARTAAP